MNRGRRLVVVAGLLAGLPLAGCSDDGMRSKTGRCGGAGALTVAPATLARGELTAIAVVWEVQGEPEDARALLVAGAKDDIEVEVPLASAGDSTYEGSLLNPFGAGAPAGIVTVLATAASDACGTRSAATSFLLE